MSERILNGTSAQIGYLIPYALNRRHFVNYKYNASKHYSNKKLSYRRETSRQLRMSF